MDVLCDLTRVWRSTQFLRRPHTSYLMTTPLLARSGVWG